jgi:hypothetical protein
MTKNAVYHTGGHSFTVPGALNGYNLTLTGASAARRAEQMGKRHGYDPWQRFVERQASAQDAARGTTALKGRTT